MDLDEALETLAEVDGREIADRAARLVELTALLGDEILGFSGQAAQWLFEDIKATWIYGYFAATVLAANAFCIQQLAGLLRLLADDPSLPETATSLEALAALTEERGLITVDLRARLVTLNDIAHVYGSAELHEYQAKAEHRALEAERFAGEDNLLTDARSAVMCSVAVVHRRA